MRKRYKSKLRSCGLCKPHKRGIDRRWRPQELQLGEFAERAMRFALRRGTAGHLRRDPEAAARSGFAFD